MLARPPVLCNSPVMLCLQPCFAMTPQLAGAHRRDGGGAANVCKSAAPVSGSGRGMGRRRGELLPRGAAAAGGAALQAAAGRGAARGS